ncbi:hypothetical protein ACN4EE_05225 [Geminocystis sp. CENA526]|uniref:hypothetical protein n=1 Tax=Geminocystis sp. CENA526 TaxID=1355871 RepID=UPI003D6E64C9
MAITLEEIMAKMPEERQKKILARAEELKKEEGDFRATEVLLIKKPRQKFPKAKKLIKK